MEDNYKNIVKTLKKYKKTISTMESCTGGALASEITNISGASNILKFSAVTYSNEFKVKMGVSKDVIEQYTVYSKETAREMAKAISNFTESSYGIGITGKLGRRDPHNLCGNDNQVFICIYDREKKFYDDLCLDVIGRKRSEAKDEILNFIGEKLQEYLNV